MYRARVPLVPAWVLKTAAYGDTSLLVEAFSRDQGRVGLVARGARGAKSRQRALLQVFQPLLLSWNERGDLGTLTGVEAAGVALDLRGETVFSGWYLNELLLRLLQRHDVHAGVFDAYGAALRELSTQGERALRRFELQLLAELGFGLDFPDHLESGCRYAYRLGEGPVRVAAPEGYAGRALIALRDDTLHAPEDLDAARALLRTALNELLGGRDLATARTLRALRRQVTARN